MIGQMATTGGTKTIISGADLLGRIRPRPLVHSLLNTSQYWRYAKQKTALVKVIVWVAKILPEPKGDNLLQPNSRRLQKERELFQKCLRDELDERKSFIDAIFKLAIIAIEQGGLYRKALDRAFKDLLEDGWEFNPVEGENEWWDEQNLLRH